jgi:uncharacterized protein YbgA (DUF1722 family)
MEHEDLCGFIFKKDSPSSGLFRVKIYNARMPVRSGSGLFAYAVAKHFPLLSLEEAGRLNDAGIRENFIDRIFCYHRWKDFLRDSPDLGRLVTFHTRHKLFVLSHSTSIYREMGSLVAQGKELTWPELVQRYEELFMKALALHATVKKNINVLLHIMGYFKRELNSFEKAELLEVISGYHNYLVPLVVPLTLLKHYVGKYGQQYLQQQFYLSPHPAELMLRNHV